MPSFLHFGDDIVLNNIAIPMDYFNFCHPCLNPSVKSSAVSAEGYDVTNLISSDLNVIQKGFMVYRTINPPVNVTFTFMCKINISHMIIWPQVGNQKSIGFQIFTGCENSNVTQPNPTFVSVGFAYLKNEPGIVFHHAYEPSNSTISNFLRRRLITRQNSLMAVNVVQIKIMKTHQSSVPSLLRVEIWGMPSISCPKEIRMKVLDFWAHKDRKINVKRSAPEKKEENELRSTALALVSSNFEIPEDFVDPITCEVMVLPFILPSGKIVDQRTLEKHENHEANWGRRPSDPFTGKLYTETSKPVLAAALKARIDKFLIEHADVDELKRIPRTVGRISSSCHFDRKNVESASNNLPQPSSSKTFGTGPCVEFMKSHEHKNSVVLADKRKTKFELIEFRNKKMKCQDKSSSNLDTVFINSFSNIAPASSKDCSGSTHEDLLQDSLDAALKSALSGLPSFTNFTLKIQDNKNKCSVCSENEILYILPCQHILCRNCLTKKISDKNCKCTSCDCTFNSADPKRYFI